MALYCREDGEKIGSPMWLCRFDEAVRKVRKWQMVESEAWNKPPTVHLWEPREKEKPCSTENVFFFLFLHSGANTWVLFRQKSLIFLFSFGIKGLIAYLVTKNRGEPLPRVNAKGLLHSREWMNDEMKPHVWFYRGKTREKLGFTDWVAMVTVLLNWSVPPIQDRVNCQAQVSLTEGQRAQLLLPHDDSCWGLPSSALLYVVLNRRSANI